ncbi:MAG: hypothetical protein P1V33_08215 [Pseudohongiella nitratireducens]|nr:hypothetical protein [Pseudohongiella nitratireducens]MDF1623437.1 hypothetical protein [Pseudohongiella nitratireducens]
MNLFKSKKTTRHTSFSDFVRNASSAEKKRVYKIVLERATAEQNAVLLKARELEHIGQ